MIEKNVLEGFVIDTDQKAQWAVDKIREARADRDRWIAFYEGQIKAIKEQTDFDTMNLERMLAEYFATVPHASTKTQENYKLPNGKLVLKLQNPEYKRDDATVIDWLKKNKKPEFIKVSESLDWAGLKKVTAAFNGALVDENGEVIPGVEVIEREPKFTVEV